MARRTKKPRQNTGRWDIPRGRQVRLWERLSPPQLFVGSFLMLIGFGTLGLKFLPGLYRGEPLGWTDSLFTSTSAVCVTGLIVVDTATHFTTAGQAFLLLLIQLGGLGMLALTSMIIVALGRRLSLRSESLVAGPRIAAPHLELRQMIVDVVRFTLVFEAVGAVALYALWVPRFGWAGAAWPALFHSVSAFCNAGFSTFSDSLIGFRESPLSLVVIMFLIIAGGVGFLTLEEIYHFGLRRRRNGYPIFSLHSKLVLWATLVLLLGGWLLFALFEWTHGLRHLAVTDRLANALFMSTTARTAGFNTIDYAQASDSSNFLTILLMMIGGSPGSTAGGMKTTTFALVGLLAWSRLLSSETTNFSRRSIPDETIQRAIGLVVVAIGVLAVGVFALAASGDFHVGRERFLTRMFEAASAFNTVGLSMGLTDKLSVTGRYIIILLMFLGRVGPVTLAAALLVRRSGAHRFRYAYEDVVVG